VFATWRRVHARPRPSGTVSPAARHRWTGRKENHAMSAHCQVTGRKPGFGKSVSHSHRRTNRRWNPNIQRRSYFLPSEGRRVTLTVSTKGIKTIDRDGIEAVVARIRARGEKI
jgi:large subunit ribosomal protein L28